MKAYVQNDSSANGLGWILDSQKNEEYFEMESYALLIGGLSYRDDFLQRLKGLILLGSSFLLRCKEAI